MKKNNEEFSSPQRQSQWAIIFIILRSLRKVVMQLWPFAIAAFLGRGGNSWDKYEFIAAAIGLLGMVSSVISYYKYYFHVSDTALVIKKGLIKKVNLNIPFERIQSINFRQTLIHRLLQVTELELETAGSKEQETKIDALSIPQAERLRQLLLDRRAEILNVVSDNPEVESLDFVRVEEEHAILTLSPKDMLKVGLTQNHFAPIGLLSSLFATTIFYAFSFDIDPRTFFNEIWEYIEVLSILQLVLVVIVLFVFAVLVSVIKTFLKYYDLRFWRSGERFQVVQGLFTRREFAALDRKIQILNWGQNPLERWFELINVRFRQAKSGEKKDKSMEFDIPGCDEERLQYVKEEWLGYRPSPITELHGVSRHYFWHFLQYAILIGVPILVAQAIFAELPVLIFGIALFFFSIWYRWRAYIKKKYSYTGKELYIGGGILGHRHSLLPLYKVQNVSIEQSPYQWRRKLSTLVVYTAAGTIKVPYITNEKAAAVMDHLIYQAEISRRRWM